MTPDLQTQRTSRIPATEDTNLGWNISPSRYLPIHFTHDTYTSRGTSQTLSTPTDLQRYQMIGPPVKQYAAAPGRPNAIQSAIWQVNDVARRRPDNRWVIGAPPIVAGSNLWFDSGGRFRAQQQLRVLS